MKSNHVVVAFLCATACVASVSVASADAAPQATNAQKDQSQCDSAHEQHRQATSKKKTKKAATTSAAKTGAAKTSGAKSAEHHPKKHDSSVVGRVKGAAADVNQAADTASTDAQNAIIGRQAQSNNESRAADPKLRPQTNREARRAAQAVGNTTTTAAEYVATAVQDTTRATDKPGSYNPFSIEFNPLGLIVGGRVSIQGQWVPTTHHAVIVSPHFVHTSADVAVTPENQQSQSFTGAGGEIGYRYYTGHRGANGVFIGPSLIGGVYNASLLGAEKVFTDIGVAADIGVQTTIGDHFTIGGGVGIEYLHVSHDFGDLPAGASAIASSGVKPRLLFSGGYAF